MDRPIRLIVVDLDGTLLDGAGRLDGETARALRGIERRGVRVAIASARPPRSVRRFYEALGLRTWQINYNGALIWDEPRRRVVFHRPLSGRTARAMVREARALFPEVLVSCEVLDRWYTDRFDQGHTTQTGKVFRPDVIAPVESWLQGSVTKLMFLGEPDMIPRLERRLRRSFAGRAGMVRCDPDLIQVMDRRVSKAAALRKLARSLGISLREVLAIGDAPNDAEMLQAAGTAVAVGNAHASVQRIADWVAPSNDEQGVLETLRRFGLLEPRTG